MTLRLRPVWWAAVLLAAGGPAWPQQTAADPRRGYATRPDLQELLDLYQKAADSPAYSPALRSRAQSEADLIRERLERGDFQVGDRILLTVEGEAALSDTFVVAEGPVLRLPTMKDISLAGVLRSELETHLRNQVDRVVLNAQVSSRSLVRISIVGAVARPGFYTTHSETLVGDALMLAGGPAANARIDGLTIERAGRRLWSGETLQQVIIEGRTLDQLGVRAGDRLVVPQRGAGLRGAEGSLRTLGVLLGVTFTLLGLTGVF